MPKAIKKKFGYKKEVDAEIKVQDSFEGIKKVFEKKQKSIALYGIITLGAAVAIGSIAAYRFNANDKAHQLEYEAYKVYNNMYQSTPLSGPDRAQQAFKQFEQAYDNKKSPRLLIYMADAQVEMGKYDEALKTLDEFANKFVREEALIPLVYQKMVTLQLKKGNKEEALKTLDKISNASGDMFKDFALIQKARMLEQEGKKDEAVLKYKELTEKYPQSPFSEEAKTKIVVKKEG